MLRFSPDPKSKTASKGNTKSCLVINAGTIKSFNQLAQIQQTDLKTIFNPDFCQITAEYLDLTATALKNQIRKVAGEPRFCSPVNHNLYLETANYFFKDSVLNQENVLAVLYNLLAFDQHVFEHSVNVAFLSLLLGTALKISRVELNNLVQGALVHDIGKCLVAKEILDKPSALNQEEFDIIKAHSWLGLQILTREFKFTPEVATIASQHHEKYNGQGYPFRLVGNNINLSARICAVADVYEALTTNRVYRKQHHPQDAYNFIRIGMGSHFDPDVVDCFTDFFLGIYNDELCLA